MAIRNKKKIRQSFWDSGLEGARELFDKPFRVRQILDWVAGKDQTDPAQMHNIPASVRQTISDTGGLMAVTELARQTSQDGSIKFVLQGAAGIYECVWMPFEKHSTLCVSSQSGCKMGCSFCATARMPQAINLSPAEIVGQILHVRQEGYSVQRIVFMGMGEPLQNYENLSTALDWLTSPKAFGMSPDRITVSTVGYMPELDRFWREQKVHLAISLNGYDDSSRQKWMPVGAKWSFGKLVQWANLHIQDAGRRRITFEYILAGGSTDLPEHAHALAVALRGSRIRVNLIPWNDWGEGDIKATNETAIDEFGRILNKQNIIVTVRRSRALDIAGACGQLVQMPEIDNKGTIQ